MKTTIVCPVGDQPQALFPALREFSVGHVHLLTHPSYAKQTKSLCADLDRFGIPYSKQSLSDNTWEDTFVRVGEFANSHPHPERIVVHVGTGDRNMQCAATSAAFVNGLKAVNGNKNMIFGLPVLRFNYYNSLNDRKRKILSALQTSSKTLSSISEDIGISLSLLSYHVHGNRKSEGLVDMGLVELSESDNQTVLSLSSMGRLLLRGSVPEASA